MKLASLPQGRDGRLIVVSDDLAWYADADHIVPTMQALLDEWDMYYPQLEALSIELAHAAIPRRRFHEREACAPLPRAYQRVGQHFPANDDGVIPAIYQGGSDQCGGARDAVRLTPSASGCSFAVELVVVTGDVPQGASPEQALQRIRLVGLANDIVAGSVESGKRAGDAASMQTELACHFSPVLVSPAALGDAWHGGKLSQTLMIDVNGAASGRLPTNAEHMCDFGTLISNVAKTRSLGAGSIVGAGMVSAQRKVEGSDGDATTPFLKPGDSVRIEVRDAKGKSIFGAIDQAVATA